MTKHKVIGYRLEVIAQKRFSVHRLPFSEYFTLNNSQFHYLFTNDQLPMINKCAMSNCELNISSAGGLS
jgi:hypothetical protein